MYSAICISLFVILPLHVGNLNCFSEMRHVRFVARFVKIRKSVEGALLSGEVSLSLCTFRQFQGQQFRPSERV